MSSLCPREQTRICHPCNYLCLPQTRQEYFALRTRYAHYFAEIWYQYPNLHKVFVGGKKKCVAFSVYLEEPAPQIDGIGYDSRCNIDQDHRRDTGTKHMVLTALQFVRMQYPHVETFQVRDTSTIDCAEGRYRMSLACFYLLHHHATYYEAKFHAQPVDVSSQEWAQARQAFQAYLRTHPSWTSLPRPPRISLRPLYEESRNLQDFVHRLKQEPMDCMVYKDWAEALVKRFFPNVMGMSWTIDPIRLDLPTLTKVTLLPTKPSAMFGGAQWEEATSLLR